jgi:Tfp pilus assembly protein PilF/O-antigen ligase
VTPAATLLPERLLVASAVTLTAVLFLTNTADPVNVPKLTVETTFAVLALTGLLGRAIRHRTAQAPWGLGALAAALLAAGFTVSALTAPHLGMAMHGAYGRNSGLLAYLAATVLFAVVLAAFDAGAVRFLLFAVLLGGLFTASYGLFQRLGIDAINWTNPFNPIIASLGNPDFASAYLGITAPAAAWAAAWTGWARGWRIASAATGVFCMVVAAISSAVQGPLAAAAGLAVVALALALNLTGPRRRQAIAGVIGVSLLGVLTGVVGALGVGPASSFFSGIPWLSRKWYWQAGLNMWHRSPFTGVGLDAYGAYWRRDRPLASPRRLGGAAYSDSAHSVPLQHLAQGGLLLALTYLLFVGVIAWALVTGLRRLAGQERLLLAGVGGAWTAYQVQSLVSIDQVPLLLLNFVLGAGVLVTAGVTTRREVRLPGALAAPTPGRGRKVRQPTTRRITPTDYGLWTALGVVALVALWYCLTPLRANHAAYAATVSSRAGDQQGAIDHYQHAVDLEPSVGFYRTNLGTELNNAGRAAEARTAYAESFLHDPTEVNAGLVAAQMASEAGDIPDARRLFDRALAYDPSNSATIIQWATFERNHDGGQQAIARLEQSVRDLPGEVTLWNALGDTRQLLGDKAGARKDYEQALVVQPGNADATDALKKLDAGSG